MLARALVWFYALFLVLGYLQGDPMLPLAITP